MSQRHWAFCIFKYMTYGGLQRDFLGILQAAVSAGHIVDVYTRTWEGPVPAGVRVIRVPVSGWSNHAKALSFSRRVLRLLNDSAYDLVVGFNKMPGLDVCFMGENVLAPRVVGYKKYLPRYRVYLSLERAACTAQLLVLHRKESAIVQHCYGVDAQQIHLLKPWVQQVAFSAEQAAEYRRYYRQQFGIDDSTCLLLFVAADAYTKGLDRVIPALTLRHRLLVVGGGKRTAPSYPSMVTFLGVRQDIAALMCAADVLVHPARIELAGKVLLEALVQNLPVITTAVCGCADDILAAGSGVVLPEPFSQSLFNNTLETLSCRRLSRYREQASIYENKSLFYDMPQRVLRILESTSSVRERAFFLDASLCRALPERRHACIDAVFSLQGQVYRCIKNRETIRLDLDQHAYFIKRHQGVGWYEIFKNLLTFRLPVVSAKQEYRAIRSMQAYGIAVPEIVAFAEEGCSPAAIRSFVMLKAVDYDMTLEDVVVGWKQQPPTLALKRRLIREVAHIARKMHEHGMNHRDFYLCHFLLKRPFHLTLLDLHRVQIRKQVPERWLIKDLAALYSSSLEAGLNLRDYLYFLKHYRLRKKDWSFWAKVRRRGRLS